MLSLEEQADIGIVLGVEGRILVKVNQSDLYQKEVAKKSGKRKGEREEDEGPAAARTRLQQQWAQAYLATGKAR
jgi:hypothetical protein